MAFFCKHFFFCECIRKKKRRKNERGEGGGREGNKIKKRIVGGEAGRVSLNT